MIPLKKWLSKHQNKAKFKNLDDSRVPSSNFPGLRISAASITSAASIGHLFLGVHQRTAKICHAAPWRCPKPV